MNRLKKLFGSAFALSKKKGDQNPKATRNREYRYLHSVFSYSGVVFADTQSQAVDAASKREVIALVRGASSFKWLVLRCPCRCGQIRRISTSSAVWPSWHLKLDAGGNVSLYPSVVLKRECGAHFVLRHNRALMF